jgi:hypothetical protein
MKIFSLSLALLAATGPSWAVAAGTALRELALAADPAGDLPVRVIPLPAPQPVRPVVAMGVRGDVSIGPTCAGPGRPGEVCSRPAADVLVIVTRKADGVEVARKRTDAQGEFLIPLPEGVYVVTAEGKNIGMPYRWPQRPQQDVTVSDGQIAAIELRYDTGIR